MAPTTGFSSAGVTTRRHGAAYAHDVINRDPDQSDHAEVRREVGQPGGRAVLDRKGLAHGPSAWPLAHNKEKEIEEVCVWTNDYQGTRVFGTTIGHHNETVEAPEYLDLITRGSLWACDKLNDTYLKK